MTADRSSGGTDLRESVRALLSEADERITSLDRDRDDAEAAAESLDDVAERANELFSETDPADLLAALRPAERSASDETVTDALKRSDQDTVVRFRKLLLLAELDREQADSAAGYVDDLLELSQRSTGEIGGGAPSGDDTEESESNDREGAADSADRDELADRLRDTLQGGIDEFREGVQSTRDSLQGEDGFETAESDDGSSGYASGDGTMFSTIPSRDRADMKRSTRFSTVRGRSGRGDD